MTCRGDHDSMKSSLVNFVLGTNFVGVQVFTEGFITPEVQYMGNCPVCLSTLAVTIDLARGSVVRGEIGETMEQHAGRVIR